MESAFSSTALLVAIAAILWIAYLVPVWVKRSEYLATERNATRLGQTLRVLAETAETSPELRAELTAREVWRRSRDAERQVSEFGLSEPEKKAKRRRQLRIITTVFTGIGLAGFVAAFAAQAASWVMVVTGIKVVTGVITLQLLARAARAQARVSSPRTTVAAPTTRVSSARAWVPPQIPEPLSSKQPIPTGSVTLPSREELLRQARVAASQARPEEAAREREGLAQVSEFDRMGHVPGAGATNTPNLDEVLQRRRAV